MSYGEPERAGATQLKKGRAGLTQSNREEGELGVTSGRLSLIHKPSVGIALQGNSRHTAPGGRYVIIGFSSVPSCFVSRPIVSYNMYIEPPYDVS